MKTYITHINFDKKRFYIVWLYCIDKDIFHTATLVNFNEVWSPTGELGIKIVNLEVVLTRNQFCDIAKLIKKDNNSCGMKEIDFSENYGNTNKVIIEEAFTAKVQKRMREVLDKNFSEIEEILLFKRREYIEQCHNQW
ncbi:MAG: hypothetical protein ACRCTZ_13700 [Sarcina sp.]